MILSLLPLSTTFEGKLRPTASVYAAVCLDQDSHSRGQDNNLQDEDS